MPSEPWPSVPHLHTTWIPPGVELVRETFIFFLCHLLQLWRTFSGPGSQPPMGSKLRCGADWGGVPSFSCPLLKSPQAWSLGTGTRLSLQKKSQPNLSLQLPYILQWKKLHKPTKKAKQWKNTLNTFNMELKYFLWDAWFWKCNSFKGRYCTTVGFHLFDYIPVIQQRVTWILALWMFCWA